MEIIRNYISDLIEWKNHPDRKPLVLQGARQVGKTSIIKKFGQDEYNDFVYFNFEEQFHIKKIFEETKNVNRVIKRLSTDVGRKIKPEKTLIFFDEIQECNQALNTLKYFNENANEYHIICAGSLLGIALNGDTSFPVGKVDFLTINPLTYSEILRYAEPELYAFTETVKEIKINGNNQIPENFQSDLLLSLKNYFVTGGMPEAAKKYANTKNIKETDKILLNILKAYKLDFSKHTTKIDALKIDFIWNSIPSQLAKENKKFIFQVLKSGARAKDYEYSLEWLIRSGLINKLNLNKKPAIPLKAYDDLSSFKMYVFDVGVLRILSDLDTLTLLQGNDIFTEFKGSLTENYIIESLVNQFDIALRYWTSEGKAEVDLLLQYRGNIIPIEIKAANNTQSKSLNVYNQLYKPKLRIRFSTKNLSYEDGFLCIPLFFADKTKSFIDSILDKVDK